ncbi:MAG: hypothetical protein MZV64_35055 [Ignavibacteriales bacterium]|nr:hypothetical protein [Ignavibacteriales bacterium]
MTRLQREGRPSPRFSTDDAAVLPAHRRRRAVDGEVGLVRRPARRADV